MKQIVFLNWVRKYRTSLAGQRIYKHREQRQRIMEMHKPANNQARHQYHCRHLHGHPPARSWMVKLIHCYNQPIQTPRPSRRSRPWEGRSRERIRRHLRRPRRTTPRSLKEKGSWAYSNQNRVTNKAQDTAFTPVPCITNNEHITYLLIKYIFKLITKCTKSILPYPMWINSSDIDVVFLLYYMGLPNVIFWLLFQIPSSTRCRFLWLVPWRFWQWFWKHLLRIRL